MRAFLFSAAMLLSVAVAAGAAASPVDKTLRGFWAAPDCGTYSEALILTENFYLRSTETETVFSSAWSAKRGDYSVLDIAGASHPATRTEDSILEISNMGGTAPQTWPKTRDALRPAGRSQYAGCPDAPSVVPVPLVRVMSFIDALKDACAPGIGDACGKLLFSISDVNKNKKISRAEFRKMGAMLFVFAPLSEENPVSTANLEAAYKAGIVEGGIAADAVLASRDKNHSGDLDREELIGFSADLHSPTVRAALAQAGKVIPSFMAVAP